MTLGPRVCPTGYRCSLRQAGSLSFYWWSMGTGTVVVMSGSLDRRMQRSIQHPFPSTSLPLQLRVTVELITNCFCNRPITISNPLTLPTHPSCPTRSYTLILLSRCSLVNPPHLHVIHPCSSRFSSSWSTPPWAYHSAYHPN